MIVQWITIGVAVLAAIPGLIALFQAGNANRLAQDSNRIAEDAVRKADMANRVAAEANKISSDANTISERALAAAEDETIYRWLIQHDKGSPSLVITNDGPESAFKLSVTVRHGQETISEGFSERVDPLGELRLEADLLNKAVRAKGTDNGAIGPIRVLITTYLTWETPTGVTKSEEIKKRLR